jgi:capsular exopolysaccharide synthesis family protein
VAQPSRSFRLPETPQGLTAGALLKPLRKHWLLAVCLGVLAAAAASGTTWYAVPASHTAFALLRVASVEPRMVFPTADTRVDYGTYQKTQISLIKSPLVLNAALRQPAIAALPCVLEQLDPVTWLAKEVLVDYAGGSEVLRISLTGSIPDELAKLVNAIKDAYLQEVVNAESQQRLARIRELDKIYTESEEKTRSKRNLLRQLARTLGTSDSQALTLKQQMAVQHFGELRKEHTRVQFELMRARVEALSQQARGEAPAGEKVAEALLEDYASTDPQTQQLLARLGQVQRVIARYEHVAVRKDEPSLVEYRAEAKALQKKLDDRRAELLPLLAKRLREKARGEKEMSVARLKDQIALLADQEKLLREEVEHYAKEVDKIGNSSADLELMRAEVEQVDAITKRVGAEKQALEVEIRSRPRVTLIQEASVPQAAEFKKKAAVTALAGLLAFGAVAVWIGWREHRAARIDSAEEVASALGLRVLGTLPASPRKWRDRGRGRKGPALSGQQPFMESIGSIRALLVHDASLGATRVVLVTSALENEGKTTVASHLAASLARAGRKTLLVDCDLRRPALHQVFRMEPLPGLSEVLRGEAELFEAIRPTAEPGLELLAAGAADAQALQALARDDVQSLFEAVRLKYDFVVIDSSPVLPVADSLLLAKHADAVLLAIRRDVSRVPTTQTACQRLEMVGVRVLGAVVTGVREAAPGRYERDVQRQAA